MNTLPWPLNSRKAISIIAGIVVTVVLLATGQIDGETAGTLITAQVVALITTIAWEDTAAKRAAGDITAGGDVMVTPVVEVEKDSGPVS